MNTKAKLFTSLALVSLLTISGCSITGGHSRNQNAMVFADEQANQMRVHGGSFMRNALGSDNCPEGAESERLRNKKDAYIVNNNGGVRFGITYSGRGDAECN